ncbi:MAG: hypothetical protein A3I05_01590 [Deltaproteobacteria bacterium RIFCSPLOWO2_02_FULL_44_10]|nr:MAG: hypothetical protein A3C46_05185 [Deltaproteobacteria bacterium RIFCSPHIGHO2_02_FULL_44_16]OGQ45344.1 MAG: hypothetical protein A3I05_01590 [Deltaproteobacteria bacterium RIFCSPLOWO2_02_FULL_44_10]
MQRPLKYIAVDGPIGAGKTTLVKMLAEDLGGHAIFEPVEKNPFLPDFYKDPKRNAFKTQLFFLLNRYQQQMELKQHDLFYPLIICDYTFIKDAIFAEINLSDDEMHLYHAVFQLLSQKLPSPDLVIYLRADSGVLMQRVKKRGYGFEKPITEEYLEQITDAYNRHFLNYSQTPLLVVDTSSINYESNPEDYAQLKRAILNHRGGTMHVIQR